MTFAQPLGASGVFLCRHISSSSGKPAEESSITLDALGDIVEGLVPEKSVEAAIDGIHDLTGFNWYPFYLNLVGLLCSVTV